MQCRDCGDEVVEGSKFCGKCGTPLPRGCRNCGHTVPAQNSFCSECGTRVAIGNVNSAPSTKKRQQLYSRIVNSIVKRFPHFAQAEPEVVAHHYQAGGDARSALTYWSAAGDMADRRSASRKAASHYRTALMLIPKVDGARELRELEIDLNIKLGNALIPSEGYTSEDARECYVRARTQSRPNRSCKASQARCWPRHICRHAKALDISFPLSLLARAGETNRMRDAAYTSSRRFSVNVVSRMSLMGQGL